MNFDFLKTTAPIVFNQRFEPGNLGSESKPRYAQPRKLHKLLGLSGYARVFGYQHSMHDP